MNIAYKLDLICSQCGADVVLTGSDTRDDMYVARKLGRAYQPGQPKPKVRWRLDGKIIKQLSSARKWVRDNPVVTYAFSIFGSSSTTPELPEGVGITVVGNEATPYVKLVEYRFVDCPACGGRAYMGSGTRRDSS